MLRQREREQFAKQVPLVQVEVSVRPFNVCGPTDAFDRNASSNTKESSAVGGAESRLESLRKFRVPQGATKTSHEALF
eukprot:5230989-Amphidinium_carterae.2